LEFENTKLVKLFEVVPAETFILVNAFGTEICIDPLEYPTVAAPNPLKDSVRASNVVLEFCVVFPIA